MKSGGHHYKWLISMGIAISPLQIKKDVQELHIKVTN